jgi:hypothetical protein
MNMPIAAASSDMKISLIIYFPMLKLLRSISSSIAHLVETVRFSEELPLNAKLRDRNFQVTLPPNGTPINMTFTLIDQHSGRRKGFALMRSHVLFDFDCR